MTNKNIILQFTTALTEGDCGAPLWKEKEEGNPKIVALYEGWSKKHLSGLPDGYGHDMWLTSVANNKVLEFINDIISKT